MSGEEFSSSPRCSRPWLRSTPTWRSNVTSPCSPLSEVDTSRMEARVSALAGASRGAAARASMSTCLATRENPSYCGNSSGLTGHVAMHCPARSGNGLCRPPIPRRQPQNPRRDHVHRWWSSTAHLDHCCRRACDAPLNALGIRDTFTVSRDRCGCPSAGPDARPSAAADEHGAKSTERTGAGSARSSILSPVAVADCSAVVLGSAEHTSSSCIRVVRTIELLNVEVW